MAASAPREAETPTSFVEAGASRSLLGPARLDRAAALVKFGRPRRPLSRMVVTVARWTFSVQSTYTPKAGRCAKSVSNWTFIEARSVINWNALESCCVAAVLRHIPPPHNRSLSCAIKA
jgi:hypothetical protein